MAAAANDYKDADAALVIQENDDDLADFQLRDKTVNPSVVKVSAADAKDFGLKVKTAKELAADPLFACEDATTEKFGAVKPWLGAIAHTTPSKAPANNAAAPDKGLALDWVYGYRGFDAFGNLVYNTKGQCVYPIAGVVVVYDAKTHTQSHYLGHNNDIVCLAQNPANKDIIATGQVATITDGLATHPHVCVFNSVTKQEWILKSNGTNLRRAVRSVAFSADGKYLATVGQDDNQMVTVWDWEKKVPIASDKGGTDKIFQVKWNHVAGKQSEFCTVGVKHVFLWAFDGAKVTKKRASLGGKYALQTFYSVAFSQKGAACVGARDGSIYAFVDGTCKATVANAHAGGVLCVDYYPEGLVTGGEDGKALIFDQGLKLKQTLQFNNAVRSVYVSGANLLVGTGACDIYHVVNFKDGKVEEPIVRGHFDGELWGLGRSPVDPTAFVTASEDNRIMQWNAKTHSFVRSGQVNAKAGVKPKVRKAATDSRHAINQCARSVEYSPNGQHIAIGTNSGEVNVYTAADMKLIATVDLNKYGKRKLDVQTQNWIEVMSFSPNGKFLAVGTHGMVIALLDVAGGYKYYASLKAHNAAVTHLDWSADSKYVQSVCRAYELLFHNVDEKDSAKCAQITAIAGLKDVAWATQTCIFGWPVQGIFSPSMDGTDVNYCDRNNAGTLMVTGDDFGKVNLFRYPVAKQGNKAKAYGGHSAHVTRTRFTADDQFVISTGGGDKAIMQWKLA